jgi:predicted PurR-regulated permease PerM
MKGTVLVGLAQGFLGGLLFWAVGIEAAVFWGVVMTVLSFLPVFGASLIWIPAAIILMATGSLIKGIVLLAAGVVLISLADNLLRPILVGRETRLPDYIILVSTLGGISLFGISGLVIGPVLAALFLTIWEMFAQEFCEEKAGSAEEPASQEAGEA